MIVRLLVSVFAITFTACTNSSTESTQKRIDTIGIVKQDTSVVYALKQLRGLFAKNKDVERSSTIRNEQIQLGDTTIRLNIKVEYNGQKDGKNIYAANFITTLAMPAGENTEIDNGIIGIGSSEHEAYETCVQDWLNVLGNPLVGLLQNNNDFTIDHLKVYAGLMGVRGQIPANTWLKGDEAMSQKIFEKIGKTVKANTKQIVPVDIKLLVEKGTVINGECRIGNMVSLELLKKLKELPWPKATEKFIFSQFYLVEKEGGNVEK